MKIHNVKFIFVKLITMCLLAVFIAAFLWGSLPGKVSEAEPGSWPNPGLISTSPEGNPAIPTQSTMQRQSALNAGTDGWEWVEGSTEYTYVTGWTGIPGETGFGTYVSYYQNAENRYPFINSIYYIAVTVYGISSPQAGTMSAYITFLLPPNTSLAISSGTPMRCFGGEIPFQEFTCDYSLQQLYPGVNQYAIPSGEYGNVWPIAAGAGWEFLIPVKTSTTLNNSTLWGEITNIDGYQIPPKLYPQVPIYVWEGPAEAPGAFNKYEPVNGAIGIEIYPQLSWYDSARAASYYYCLDTTNDNNCSNWISETVAVSELLPGTTYYWQIKAVNDNGTTYADGSLSSFWSFTTKTSVSPPGAFNKSSPINDATGVSNNPTIAWAASNGAIIYQYCYDTSNDNACSSWYSTYDTSVTLGGLTSGVKYYWHIRALNYDGTTYSNGSPVSYWSFTTADATIKPANFNKINPSNGEDEVPTNPTLSWGSISNVISYEYCYDDSNDNACSPWLTNGIITSKSLSGLLPAKTYYWQVRANNSAGTTYANGSEVAFWSFKTKSIKLYLPSIMKNYAPPPLAFSKISPTNGATGQSISPTLTWEDSSGATSYEYCYDTTDDNACTSWAGNGTAISKSLSGLSTGTSYYWQVRAKNSSGTTYANGISSAFWSFTTGTPPPPPGLNAIVNTDGDGTYTVSWSSSPGAATYILQEDDNEGFSNPTNVFGGSNTSKEITGKNVGGRYYYRVNASNIFGSSNWSNVVSTFLCPRPGIWKGNTSPGYAIEFRIQSTPVCQIVAGSLKIFLGSPYGTITYPNSYNITSSHISFSGNYLQMEGNFSSFTTANGSFSYTGTPTISGNWNVNYYSP